MYRFPILFMLLFVCVKYGFAQKNTFLITGQLKNLQKGEIIYLLKGQVPGKKEDWEIVDSTKEYNGGFNFKISIAVPDFYMLFLSGYRWCTFIAEPNKKIGIDGDANNLLNARIAGTLNNEILQKFSESVAPFIEKMNAYADSADKPITDTVQYNYYVSQNSYWGKRIKTANLNIIKSEPKSFLALSKMQAYYDEFSGDQVREYLKELPRDLISHFIVKEIYYNKFQRENDIKRITKFYDLKFFDTAGKSIDFKEYYGNIVLVDFWASWCKPCIANIPSLDTLYTNYKHTNFKILSISMDVTKKNWKRGMLVAPTEWANVSDLKGWQGLAVEYFKIESIPRYVLLNVDGGIISSDVNINELANLISQHISGKEK
jgi:thiol-disulfide isomerase/thioredoxin